MASEVDDYAAAALSPRLVALGFRASKRRYVRRSPSRELAIEVNVEASRFNTPAKYGIPAAFRFEVFLFGGRDVPTDHKKLLMASPQRTDQSPVATAIWGSMDFAAHMYTVNEPRALEALDGLVSPLLKLDTFDDAVRWIESQPGRKRFYMLGRALGAMSRSAEARAMFQREIATAVPGLAPAEQGPFSARIAAAAAVFGITL